MLELLLVAMLASASPERSIEPPPAGVQPLVIATPDWIELPTSDDFKREYPPEALLEGIGSQTFIACSVRPDGTLSDCTVKSEGPKGLGFGAATVRIARNFRMRSTLRDGQSVGGARVVVPVSWEAVGDHDALFDVQLLEPRPKTLALPEGLRAYATWLRERVLAADHPQHGACTAPVVASLGIAVPVLRDALPDSLKPARGTREVYLERVHVGGCPGGDRVHYLIVSRTAQGQLVSKIAPQVGGWMPASVLSEQERVAHPPPPFILQVASREDWVEYRSPMPGTPQILTVANLHERPDDLTPTQHLHDYAVWLTGQVLRAENEASGGKCTAVEVTSRGPVTAVPAAQFPDDHHPRPKARAYVEAVEVVGCGRRSVRLLMVWGDDMDHWQSVDFPQGRALVPPAQLGLKPH